MSTRPRPPGSSGTVWSEAEDALIRAHYPEGGIHATRDHLPRRTDDAIRRRAVQIGAKRLGKRYRNAHTPAAGIDFATLVAKHCQPSVGRESAAHPADFQSAAPPADSESAAPPANPLAALGPDALYQDWRAAMDRIRHRLATPGDRP